VSGWSDFPLVDWLSDLTGAPTLLENDANTAALGEAMRGAGRGFDPVFYTTLGSGVGGGLVCGGRIYHGRRPGEAEVGHLRLDRRGTIVEDRCSGWAIDRLVRAEIQKHPKCALARLAVGEPGAEARHLSAALEQGDELARGILAGLANDLAMAFSHVTHLMNPEVIVLGGGLSGMGEPLRAAIADRLPTQLMEVLRPGPGIALSALGEDAVPVGGLLLAREIAFGLSKAASEND
jgi:glucokinase